MTNDNPAELGSLIALVARLRRPDGCPWDREQQLADLRAYLIEEAHEVATAIDANDWPAIVEELGDLLFQIAFVIRLGEESGDTGLGAVIDGIRKKMIARHPHVFGDESADDADAVRRNWERRKARESDRSLLAGLPSSLPALLFAFRMTQKAAGVGFDWDRSEAVLAKLHEEIGELEVEIAATQSLQESGAPAGGEQRDRLEDELGDVLFTAANLGRHLGLDPEAALARANAKFRRRFERVEAMLAEAGQTLAEVDQAALEALWQRVKAEEVSPPAAPAER